jgi:hypothetical protein
MDNHAPARNATHGTPFFSRPTTFQTTRIPRWMELDAELQQALVRLLTRMIGDHLPGSRARAGKEAADERR